jgi:hypothetical protein
MVILVHPWLVEADTTISGHFLWTEMEGSTNRAWPTRQSANIQEIAKMALFNPCMQYFFFWAK